VPSGFKTFEDKEARIRFGYPSAWSVKRETLAKSAEGEYVIYALTQPAEGGAPRAASLQLVPDPEHFTPEQIYANKWRSAAASATVTTRTIDVAASKGFAVEASRPTTQGPAVRTYEAIASVGGRIAVMSFETTDTAAWDRTKSALDQVMASLAAY
jgi:hypothetical protein